MSHHGLRSSPSFRWRLQGRSSAETSGVANCGLKGESQMSENPHIAHRGSWASRIAFCTSISLCTRLRSCSRCGFDNDMARQNLGCRHRKKERASTGSPWLSGACFAKPFIGTSRVQRSARWQHDERHILRVVRNAAIDLLCLYLQYRQYTNIHQHAQRRLQNLKAQPGSREFGTAGTL